MSITRMVPSAIAIIALRAKMSNQERADHPLTREQAWTLARMTNPPKGAIVDYRAFGLHSLMDIAMGLEPEPANIHDDRLWADIGIFLQDELDSTGYTIGVMRRFARECPFAFMASWARGHWRRLEKKNETLAQAA